MNVKLQELEVILYLPSYEIQINDETDLVSLLKKSLPLLFDTHP